MAKEHKTHKKGARRWAFPLGLLIAVLAVIGAVTIVVAGVNVTKKSIQKSRNFDEYNKLLAPVVMNDPDPFDDLTKANPSQLLDISIWSILKKDLSPDHYEYTEGGMLIPEADVTEEFKRIFGTEVQPAHATVEGFGYEFTYDANRKAYIIPLTGVVPLYTPRVVKKDKKNNTIILTVAYLSGEQWQQDALGNMVAPEPEKFMRVTLREQGDSYYISALQTTAAPDTATTAPTEAQKPTETTTAAPQTQAPQTDASQATTAESAAPPTSEAAA